MVLIKESLHHSSNQKFYSNTFSDLFVCVVLLPIKLLCLKAKIKYYHHVMTQTKNLEFMSVWTAIGSGSDG